MLVHEAQSEMRAAFLGGSVGQAVSGTIWLISAVLGTLVGVQAGIISLFALGFFIFPLTQLALRLAGRPVRLSSGNPLEALGRQVAFVLPLCLPVIAAAALYNVNWYYPAFAVVTGAHYLPFVFLYGERLYAILAGLLIVGGAAIGYLLPGAFPPAGWYTAAVLLLFAFLLWRSAAPRD
jgi:hypothetical protein